MKRFKAIAAMSLNRVIGAGNRIPWHLPEDFKWFKRTTTGQTVVMGRKTYESIGRTLPNRTTIVLSRSPFVVSGVRWASDLSEIVPEAEVGEVYICGGAHIYQHTLPLCSDLYLTLVKRVIEGGDAFFPEFESRFEKVATLHEGDDFDILHYRNRH